MNKKGMNLVEILTVLIIAGILASMAYVNYRAARERVFDREAVANLRVIQAAQKDYNLDNPPFYYPNAGSQNDIQTINNVLKLAIPSGPQRNWNYKVYSNGDGCATRITDGRNFLLRIGNIDTEPETPVACPP